MDNNELSTNLASLGTDCISRQAAISAICNACGKIDCDKMDKCEKLQLSPANCSETPNNSDTISRQQAIDALYSVDEYNSRSVKAIKQLPPAEPDIIYCKDCLKHNKRIGDYVEKSDGTYDWIWKDKACPLAEFRGKAQGHEFDYQFCAFAERRTE